MRWPASVRRRFLAPEVVQTSAMDCGPASLKCLLDGFGLEVSYGRLREVCQTDVDGTSIDTLEEVVQQLGLDAAQVMIPADHLLLPEARALPAILVVRLPRGDAHFVVVWRRVGNLVQVMDPASGRHWTTARKLLSRLYQHVMPVSAAAWREWAGSDEFLAVLRRRLADLRIPRGDGQALLTAAVADPGWRSLAVLDAAARTTASLVSAGALRRGREAGATLGSLVTAPAGQESLIPDGFWSVTAAPAGPDGEERVALRGAVLIRVRGRRAPVGATETEPGAAPLRPELAEALRQRVERLTSEVFRLLTGRGAIGPWGVVGLALLAAGMVAAEAVLFRALLEARRDLALPHQRFGAIAAVVAFLLLRWLLQAQVFSGSLRLGRLLDGNLRLALLRKIPRLADSYFRSRLTSDMAERAHSAHAVRTLPWVGAQLTTAVGELLATTVGIIWLDLRAAPQALAVAAAVVATPLLAQSILAERDLRLRTHAAALSRFSLDGLLGLVALKAHGAERSLRQEHEELLREWGRAADRLRRAALAFEGVQSAVGFGLAAWLVASYLARTADSAAALLLLYWALKLPVIGQEMTLVARQVPLQRNVLSRLLEPLGAEEEECQHCKGEPESRVAPPASTSLAFSLRGVSVRAAGHTILSGLDLAVGPGEHVAVVGRSGAGKTSLVGILLGWHRAAEGTVVVDGEPFVGAAVGRLRRRCAWVDPTVQLWNRSLLENLLYGVGETGPSELQGRIADADLWPVVQTLPEGLASPLGEAGGFLSGGEGQRVRLARALLRADASLVILDEPFRGLDRGQRARLLARARERWREATLLCITHDVGETRTFPRVVVVDGGRIVEDGSPAELEGRAGSHYRALLDAEAEVRSALWDSPVWRRAELADGRLTPAGGTGW